MCIEGRRRLKLRERGFETIQRRPLQDRRSSGDFFHLSHIAVAVEGKIAARFKTGTGAFVKASGERSHAEIV